MIDDNNNNVSYMSTFVVLLMIVFLIIICFIVPIQMTVEHYDGQRKQKELNDRKELRTFDESPEEVETRNHFKNEQL